jgi:hypothetical protein
MHELDVAAEEHRRRIADRFHLERNRRLGGFDRGVNGRRVREFLRRLSE